MEQMSPSLPAQAVLTLQKGRERQANSGHLPAKATETTGTPSILRSNYTIYYIEKETKTTTVTGSLPSFSLLASWPPFSAAQDSSGISSVSFTPPSSWCIVYEGVVLDVVSLLFGCSLRLPRPACISSAAWPLPAHCPHCPHCPPRK